MAKRNVELSKECNLPLIKTIIKDQKSPLFYIIPTPWIDVEVYLLGEFNSFAIEINIYLQNPWGVYWDFKEIQNVWLHEYLHYLDFSTNCMPPIGAHNELFDQRLKELGWYVY